MVIKNLQIDRESYYRVEPFMKGARITLVEHDGNYNDIEFIKSFEVPELMLQNLADTLIEIKKDKE